MKKLLLLMLLLIPCLTSAQIEHRGLTIPGEAIQVTKSNNPPPVWTRDGLILELYAENYVKNGLGVPAVWTDTSGEGNNASQTVDTEKPTLLPRAYGNALAGNSIVVHYANRPTDCTIVQFRERTWNKTSGYYLYGGTNESTAIWSYQDYSTQAYIGYEGNNFTPPTYTNLASDAVIVTVHAAAKRRLIIKSSADNRDVSQATTLSGSPNKWVNIGGTATTSISTLGDYIYCFLVYNRQLNDEEINGVISWIKWKYEVPW